VEIFFYQVLHVLIVLCCKLIRVGLVPLLDFQFGSVPPQISFGFELLTCQKPIFGHNYLICRNIVSSTKTLVYYHDASPTGAHDPGDLDLESLIFKWPYALFWLEAIVRDLLPKIGHMTISKVKFKVTWVISLQIKELQPK